MRITIGTRKSKLAMWQAETVAAMLAKGGFEPHINSMETIGDKILDTSIAKIGSKGVFTVELEEQLESGLTDIAVHSAKDMQSELPDGFDLIAFTEREKTNDVLLSHKEGIDITDSSKPLVVGTSSVRRRAFLQSRYPHVRIVEMRGNLQTRIQKMKNGDCDALMLAYAGVFRMGYQNMIVYEFGTDEFIPPVGQGCIAIEAASSLDAQKAARVRECVNNTESEICLLAERAFLRELQGGCSIPAFGYATLDGDRVRLVAGLSSLDGSRILKIEETGGHTQAAEIGRKAGEYILQNGGMEMLAEIKAEQGNCNV